MRLNVFSVLKIHCKQSKAKILDNFEIKDLKFYTEFPRSSSVIFGCYSKRIFSASHPHTSSFKECMRHLVLNCFHLGAVCQKSWPKIGWFPFWVALFPSEKSWISHCDWHNYCELFGRTKLRVDNLPNLWISIYCANFRYWSTLQWWIYIKFWTCAISRFNFLHFHAVFRKIWPINSLAFPMGFAVPLHCFKCFALITKIMVTDLVGNMRWGRFHGLDIHY